VIFLKIYALPPDPFCARRTSNRMEDTVGLPLSYRTLDIQMHGTG
jgi:hypothetical protein